TWRQGRTISQKPVCGLLSHESGFAAIRSVACDPSQVLHLDHNCQMLSMIPAGSRAVRLGTATPARAGKVSLPPISRRELPPCDTTDDGARVRHEDLKLIPAIGNHENRVSRYTENRVYGRVGAGAIRVHGVGPFGSRADDVAV